MNSLAVLKVGIDLDADSRGIAFAIGAAGTPAAKGMEYIWSIRLISRYISIMSTVITILQIIYGRHLHMCKHCAMLVKKWPVLTLIFTL